MKFIRLLAALLGLAAALVGILAAVALLPAVQTWIAQSALARQPGLKASLASVSAGFGEADIEDLRLEYGGAVLTVPKLRAKLPVTTAVLDRRLQVRSLVAKGWVLDLTHVKGTPPGAGGAHSAPAGAPEAAGRPDAAAARAFGGFLRGLRLPVEGSFDGVSLEGDVLVPAAREGSTVTVHVVLKGGGLSAGREGTFALDAGCDLSDAATRWSSLAAHGTVAVRMDASRGVGSIALAADVAAMRGSSPENFTLATKIEGAGPEGEAFTFALGNGLSHVNLSATLSRDSDAVSGHWGLGLGDSEVGAFLPGRRLPSFRIEGGGAFDTDTTFSVVRVRGRLVTQASHLGAIASPLEGLGVVEVDSEFELTHSGHTARVGSLRMSVGSGGSEAAASALQAFDVDERTGHVGASDPRADLLDVLIKATPLTRLSGLAGGLALTGGDAKGDLVVSRTQSGFSIRARTAITAAGVSLRGPGGTLLEGVDLSVSPVAEMGRGHWTVRFAPLSIDRGGRRLATVEASASGTPGASPSATLKGKWTADLEAASSLGAAPAFPWIRGRTASGDFSATLGNAAELEATVAAVGLDPGRTLSASVKTTRESDGSVSLLVPVKIVSAKESTDVSAEGTWYGWGAGGGGDITLTGGRVSLGQLRMLGGPLEALEAVTGPPRPATPPAAGAGPTPFWEGWSGRVAFTFDSLSAGESEFSDVGGTLDIGPDAVRLEGGRGGINHRNQTKIEGSIAFDASAALPYQVKATTASATDVDAAALFPGPAGQGALVEGRFSVAGVIAGSGASLDDLAARSEARFRLASTTGIVRLLQTSVAESIPEASTPVSDTLETVGSAVGTFFGHRGDTLTSGRNPVSRNAEAVMSFTNEVSEIGCDQVTVDAVRGGDGGIRLAAIEVVSRDVHLKGTGTIGHEAGTPLFAEPLSVDLQFGARGRVADLLRTAGLLSGRKDEQGYSLLSGPVHLAGTLDHVDTSQWHQMLVEAATRKPAAAK